MRTLLLLLAASTLTVASSSAAATAANTAGPQVTLVETSSQPRPGGGQRVRYTILQRVEPLVTSRSAANSAPAAAIVSGDAVGVSYEVPEGWFALGTLVVDEYHPHAAATASVTSSATSASDAPAASTPLALAVAPAQDPVSGRALVVDVALPGHDPARLELMDVMGRRVAALELGSRGVGRHSVNLSDGQRVAPGVYLLRLAQGREARVTRVTVVD